MLKLRIVTAVISGAWCSRACFLLKPDWTVFAFGAVLTAGAGSGRRSAGLRSQPARAAYVAAIAVLARARLALDRTSPRTCSLLLARSLRLVGRRLAVARARARATSRGSRFVRRAGAGARVRGAGTSRCGTPADRCADRRSCCARAPGHRPPTSGAFFVGPAFGQAQARPAGEPRQDLGGSARAGWSRSRWSPGAARCTSACTCWRLRDRFGCAVGVFSVVGDLTESLFKRSAGVKDQRHALAGTRRRVWTASTV